MTKKEDKTADGRVWDSETKAYYNEKTPRLSAKYWINKQPVSDGDEEITDKLSTLIKQAPNRDEFTPDIIKETIRYALRIHKRNQDVFYAVASGRFRKK